nr:MAG TPA: hypothetical protein [Caudoviricetes sp.]
MSTYFSTSYLCSVFCCLLFIFLVSFSYIEYF